MTDPGPPVRIHVARNMTEAELLVAFLEGESIPCRIESEFTHDAFGAAEKGIDELDGVAVIVPADRAAEAREAVAAWVAGPAGNADAGDAPTDGS